MLIIGGKRYCGKTTELINIANTNQIPIIVLNKMRGKAIEDTVKREGKKIETIVYTEKEKIAGIKTRNILIDDLEDILQEIFFHNRIIEVTTSMPFKPLPKITKGA